MTQLGKILTFVITKSNGIYCYTYLKAHLQNNLTVTTMLRIRHIEIEVSDSQQDDRALQQQV